MNGKILDNSKTNGKWITCEEYVQTLQLREEKIDLTKPGVFFSNNEYVEFDVGGAIGIRYHFQTCDIGYDLYKDDIGDSALKEIFVRQILPIHFCNLKFMVLHANLVINFQRGKAFMISGKSSAGKSTLTYYLIKKNHLLFCDDMVVLNEDNRSIWYNPNLKLTHESCRYFDVRYNGYTEKEMINCADERATVNPVICNSIFILDPKEGIENVRVEEVVGGNKLAAIYSNLYGNDFLPILLKKKEIGLVLKKWIPFEFTRYIIQKVFQIWIKLLRKLRIYYMNNYAVLWSGGKDGCLANYLYGQEGNICKKLFSYIGTGKGKEDIIISRELLHRQSECLGIPIEIYSDSSYYEFIRKVMDKCSAEGINAIVSGDAQRNSHMMIKVMASMGLDVRPVFPLLEFSAHEIAQKLIDLKYEIVVCSQKKSIKQNILGMQYSNEFVRLCVNENIDVIGELGEYHTIVTGGVGFAQSVDYKILEYNESEMFRNVVIGIAK